MGIIRYHPDVRSGNEIEKSSRDSDCKVPKVRVKLVWDIRLLPNEHVMAEVMLQRKDTGNGNVGREVVYAYFEPIRFYAED